MFPFMSLPIEIQERILYFTDLVVGLRPLGLYQGLVINEGRAQSGGMDYSRRSINEWLKTLPLHTALFYVNRHISEMARSLVFSENRIILDPRGSFDLYNNWLDMQPQYLLDKIRYLDLAVRFSSRVDGEWNCRMPSFLKVLHRLNLPNLTFSIDGAHTYYEWEMDEEHDFIFLIDQYNSLAAELNTGNLGSLKAFFVYLPKFRSSESRIEKIVMGEDYDSAEHGKIPWQDRDPRLPHGWEWDYTVDDEVDWEGAYWLYTVEHKMLMQDIESPIDEAGRPIDL